MVSLTTLDRILTFSQTGGLHSQLANVNIRAGSVSTSPPETLDSRMVVNVVIAKDFNLARHDVQIQALEVRPS